MRLQLHNLGLEYAKSVLPAWAENPRLYALVFGLMMWGINVKFDKGDSETKNWFVVPFKYGPEIQTVIAAWNRVVFEKEGSDWWLIVSADEHFIAPITYMYSREDELAKGSIELGNFLLTRPKNYDWLPDELYPAEKPYGST